MSDITVNDIERWLACSIELKALQEEERTLRKAIGDPILAAAHKLEGSKTARQLGYKICATGKLSYSVDTAVLADVATRLSPETAALIIKSTPSVVWGQRKNLTPEESRILNEAITTRPGLLGLWIEKIADKDDANGAESANNLLKA